jgi:RNA polymerase sigma factor (sigma-70 family)
VRSPGAKRLFSVNDAMAASEAQAGVPVGADERTDAVLARRGEAAVPVQDLFRDHWLELVRLALVMVGDLATAEDVVQDAFERLHRGRHGLRKQASGLAYVRSCVLNGCRSVHRRAAAARKYSPRLAEAPGTVPPDVIGAVDDSGAVMTALQSLSRRQREVIVLRYYADLDVAEIAGTTGITPGAVRTALSRGLVALARTLGED